MIKVPFMTMPEGCDRCDFGRCKYSNPFYDHTETSRKHGYNCQVEFYEKGRYETIREAPYDELIAPTQCPLIDLDCDIEDIKAEIEQRIEMFVSAGDFGNAVTVRSILDIIDKHTKGDME